MRIGETHYRSIWLADDGWRVQVIDQAGNAHLLDYEMVMVEGDWRISAVEIVEAPGVGV